MRRPIRASRSVRKRHTVKTRARAITTLCSAYFCLLFLIYAIFLCVLVVPMAFETPKVVGGALQESVVNEVSPCSKDEEKIHIIFSTGCNLFQHWQSEVLLSSALAVGQCGKITRIVSGCEEREDEGKEKGSQRWITHQGGVTDKLVPTEDLRKSVHPKFNVHVTPMVPESKEFPWWNKPYSIAHFAEHGDYDEDDTIIIVDPDEFFIHALTISGSPYSHIIASFKINQELKGKPNLDRPMPGKPIGQYYGLGDRWLSIFDREKVCGKGSPCAKVTSQQAWDQYSVGPPYFLHASDYKKLAPLWLKFMKPVYEADRGDMQADMYAYIMAAAHLRLPHTRLDHYMVSDVGSNTEAWDWVADIKQMSCIEPRKTLPSHFYPPYAEMKDSPRVPPLLHAAQHFKAHHPVTGELWNFHKGHVPGQILDCDQPLIIPPPDDLFTLQKEKKSRRAAFMVCWLTNMVNEAVLGYREKFCKKELAPWQKRKPTRQSHMEKGMLERADSPNYNADYCVRIVETRANVPKCKGGKDAADCYPLAKRVC